LEVSALTHAGVAGTHARSPLLRLQTDERLIALIRRGNHHAFEALVARYQSRLLAFCRHMLSSREDAEDVLQEVFAAAYNAILADERAITGSRATARSTTCARRRRSASTRWTCTCPNTA
jgi:DNA-directed RNA polymerase specialized sigma24 family protein